MLAKVSTLSANKRFDIFAINNLLFVFKITCRTFCESVRVLFAIIITQYNPISNMDTVDLIRTKLGVLSSLPKHTRLKTSNGDFDLDPTWCFQGVVRLISGDSRTEMCNQLDNLVQDIQLRKDDQDFREDVSKSLSGIDNLIQFYKSSAFVKSRLENIRRKLVELSEHMPRSKVCSRCNLNVDISCSPQRNEHMKLVHGKSPVSEHDESY